MNEIPHDNPDARDSKAGSTEFSRANYPDQVGCKTLPSLDGQTITAEIEDVWGDRNTIEGIPIDATTLMNMPRLGPQIPNEVREIIDQGIGVGILSCRKEDLEGEDETDSEAMVKVYIPTLSGDVEQTVRRKNLARKVN